MSAWGVTYRLAKFALGQAGSLVTGTKARHGILEHLLMGVAAT